MADVFKLAFVLSATDKMSRVVDQAVKDSTSSLSALERRFSAIGKSVTKWGTMATAAGAGLTTGIIAVGQSAADYAGNVMDMSEATGVAAESWQKMAYAAKVSGIEQEKLRGAIIKFDKTLISAASGSGAAAEMFSDLGISIKDASGNLKAPEEVFNNVVSLFGKLENGAAKTALATELFGKSGAELLPLLNEGEQGLAKLYAEAEASGNVIKGDALTSADEYGKSLDKLKLQLKGVGLEIGTSFIPFLQELRNDISNVVGRLTEWMNKNPELVSNIASIVGKAAIAIIVIGGLSSVLGGIITFVSRLRTVFIALSTAFKIVRIATLAFNTALFASPITWIILGIVALIAAIVLLIKNWDKVATFFVELWEKVKSAFAAAWEWIKNLFFKYHPIGLIIKHWDEISAFFVGLWEKVKSAFSAAWEWIKNLFLNYTPAGLIITHWDKIVGFFSNLWERIKSTISGIPTKLYEFGQNIITGLINGIKSNFTSVTNVVSDLGKKIAGKFKGFFGINSPSRLFAEYGMNITAGLQSGLEQREHQATAAISGLATDVDNTFNNSVTMSPSQIGNSDGSFGIGFGGVTVNYSPTINLSGANGSSVADDFARQLRQHAREIERIIADITANRTRLSY